MQISYDPVKNDENIRARQLSFERAAEFDFVGAKTYIDDRKDYKETRYVSIGYLGNRLHCICFTETQSGIRVISFRKVNQREANKHGFALTKN